MVMIPSAPRVGEMNSGEPLPEAIYHLRVDKADYKLSKEKGNPMIECQFTVFGPDDAEEYHGRKVFENLMLTGDGNFRTRQFLEAAGCDEDFVLEDTEQLLGFEVAGAVQIEKPRPNPAGGEYPARNRVGRFMVIE